MSTIVTRAGKGSPLTNNEVDSNFTNLNTDKIETITSTDGSVTVTPSGTTRDLSVAVSASTTNIVVQVRNTTGATLTKGTVVYISGATGQIPTVSKALATSDATSAQTLGLMTVDLANNTNGYVTVIGLITDIDTSAYTDGAQLYLSGSTAGTLTATKPYAPTHLVYVAVVEHAHATQGKLFVKVQNGYELDELHDVSVQSPTNGQTLVFNSSNSLWEKSDTFTSPKVISDNSSSAALRITQTGSGNALLVEDSANPDSTPFVIDAGGKVNKGSTTWYAAAGVTPETQFNGGGTQASIGLNAWQAGINVQARLYFNRADSSTQGDFTDVVDSGDNLGSIHWTGSDGTAFIEAASINAAVDGTPGTNDMPGRLVFSTTADGASSPTERMRIDNAGNTGFGAASSAGRSVSISKNVTGSTVGINLFINGVAQSDATSSIRGVSTSLQTAAASFTAVEMAHFYANQSTIGAGSAVTNQYGYFVNSTLTGATNNYGFYGAIASGTGRYNLYMAGTADNYLGGNLGIGGNTAGITVDIQKAQTGAINATTVSARINPDSTVTNNGYGFATYAINAVGASTTNIYHYNANQGTYSGTAPTNQYGFSASSSLTGATNNYGFYGNLNSGTGRWNLYMQGTAANYLGGKTYIAANTELFVGGTTDATTPSLISDGTYLQINAPAGSADIRFRVAGAERGRIASTGAWSIGGAVGAESLRVTPISSAVNYAEIVGNITGFGPVLKASGSETNVYLGIQSKGTSPIYYAADNHWFNNQAGNTQLRLSNAASAVNYVQIQNATTANAPLVFANGSDTNVSLALSSKGTGGITMYSGLGATAQFNVLHTANAVNYAQITGSATGNGVTLSAAGSDSNINLLLTPKGTGSVQEVLSGTAYSLVSQYDIGTGLNQIPLNQYLGTMAYQDANAISVGTAFLGMNAGNRQVEVSGVTASGKYTLLSRDTTNNTQLIGAAGSANLGLYSTGGGEIWFYTTTGLSELQFKIARTASAVNYVQATGAAAGSRPAISAQGSDTNIGLFFNSKGNATSVIANDGGFTHTFAWTASAVNYLQSAGSAAGSGVTLSAQGSDSNIDLNLTPKGTGKVNVATRIDYKVAGVASEYSNGNAGASKTITWSNGSKQSITLDQNTTLSFSFTSCPVGNYQLKVVQDATGGRTVTWSTDTPGSTKWIGVTGSPSLNSAASSITFIGVYWDGTNAYGSAGRVNAL